ncbi:helix-turn-helix transcriptional regulator [Methylobacterium nodulans]|uniref:Transcriptional regulator, LuxR family n=1 Tax=Methylobacterium nodulans (strain LMG 21967 / CNCM I-2342 / ORS 2060) TaxID=460265 RepID=B8IDC5_METNO|nr:helix-turn-helix transcriptional regulator [Methylobacterium nodulans]ACL61291.1 transcriptional regulator, LuxR family [Methylobacterium nodulans ORS 2060]
MRRAYPAALEAVSLRLSEAVVDPGRWPSLLHEISVAVGAAGAALLQSDRRTPDVPRSEGIAAVFDQYFREGWHVRDLRTRGIPTILKGHVIGDDCVTPDEMRRAPFYTELLHPHGLQWFAGVGFYAGSSHWALSIQRTRQAGMFDRADKRQLAALSARLTEVATLSDAAGRGALDGMRSAFSAVGQPAILLHRLGGVLDLNAAADALLGEHLSLVNRRLRAKDKRVSDHLDALGAAMRSRREGEPLDVPPFTVPRAGQHPIMVRVLAIDGAARSPFIGAEALLLLDDLRPQTLRRSVGLIRLAFGLSPAEARLVSLLAAGESLYDIAEATGITRETARNQLKSAMAKTGMRRQSQLVALISRLPLPPR